MTDQFKKLVFKGIVSWGDDSCRCDDLSDGEKEGTAYIGNVDVVGLVCDTWSSKKKVICGLATSTLVDIVNGNIEGDIDAEIGWGYSEFTPMDSDSLKVGSHDLLEILERHIGENVILWISEQPFNILEETESHK